MRQNVRVLPKVALQRFLKQQVIAEGCGLPGQGHGVVTCRFAPCCIAYGAVDVVEGNEGRPGLQVMQTGRIILLDPLLGFALPASMSSNAMAPRAR
jgi:hypothetical protein